jgi:hypothetical protein
LLNSPPRRGPVYSVAGDLNGDGKKDLVVGAQTLQLYLGNGDGLPELIASNGSAIVVLFNNTSRESTSSLTPALRPE